MKLSVKERLVLLGVLPPQGDIASLKIIRKLREDLSFSEEEQRKINLESNPNDNGYSWEGEIAKEVQIGEKAMDLVVKSLKETSDKGQLHISQIEVYERFVEKEEKS